MKDFRLKHGDSLIVKELMTNESLNRREHELAISQKNLLNSDIIFVKESGNPYELTSKAT